MPKIVGFGDTEIGRDEGTHPAGSLPFGFDRLADATADLELHLSAFRVNDDVITVQHLAIEDLQCERVLNQLLDRTL
jgi:hypothetical protein